MRRELLQIFVVSLSVEVATSLWRWLRAPTDTLRAVYHGSFLGYEAERLVPWAVSFLLAASLWLFLRRLSGAGSVRPK
jgi:hypothetical protein